MSIIHEKFNGVQYCADKPGTVCVVGSRWKLDPTHGSVTIEKGENFVVIRVEDGGERVFAEGEGGGRHMWGGCIHNIADYVGPPIPLKPTCKVTDCKNPPPYGQAGMCMSCYIAEEKNIGEKMRLQDTKGPAPEQPRFRQSHLNDNGMLGTWSLRDQGRP